MTVERVVLPGQPYSGDDYKTSVGAGFAATDWGQKGWRNQLHRLEPLDLPLLAVGAGPERKAPANLRDGSLLVGWPTAKHSWHQIRNACKKVIAAGTRTGKAAHGLLVFDLDGETAVSWCLEHRCDPAATPTWQIHRNTDESRLKVAFKLSDAQQQQLGQIKTKVETKPPVKDAAGKVIAKGEAVELFHGTGQVILLGQHHKSEGLYFWPDSMGPEDLAPIPESWWQAALTIAGDTTTKAATTKARSTGKGDWRSLDPCPICGRDTTGYCSQHKDGKTIRCFHGSTFKPPMGLKPGDEITDKQGTIWAFSKVQGTGDEFSVFVAPDPDRRRKTVKTVKATTAEPGTGNAIRLKPNQILELLPEKVGDLRLNIRSGDVHTATGILNANDAGHLYLKLSTSSETWGKDVTADAVAYLANQNQFDPVADFLNDTGNELPMEQWQRLDQHLLGINDPIAAEFLPRYLIGAVARVFKPGCDVRQTPVLVGPQWRGKTALGRILFGAEHWISGVGDLGKDALMRLHTGWGIELAELDGVTRRSDQESLKAFLTETCDSIRRPYDVATVRHPRKFVFWGTSNGAALRDTTGNTRYVTIPIPDQMLPLEWAQRHRNALWARAVEQYKAGIDWNQCSEAIRNAIADRNDNFTELEPWHDRIAQVLKRKALELQLPVQVGELLQAVEVSIDRQKGIDGQRVRRIAESLGWVMERRQSGAERRRGLWPAVPQVPQAVPQDCHKANLSDGNGFGTAAISATTKPKKFDEKGEQQQDMEPQACPLDTVGAKLVALMAETPNPSDTSGSALVAPPDHLVARLVAPVSPQTISGRQADEQRIRELGRSADLSGWPDNEVAELRQSLEQAAIRRASGIAIPLQEAA
jgi:predicted P-loop ATPase